MLCKLNSILLLSSLLEILNLKLFVKVLILFAIFVRFCHAGIFCARLRAKLLVCFDRPVGWKQLVKLHLIKLIRLMCSNDGGYA